MNDQLPIILISMGDPAGIGPEIAAKALAGGRFRSICRPMIVGDAGVLMSAADAAEVDVAFNIRDALCKADFKSDGVEVLNLQNVEPEGVRWGEVSSSAGQAAFEYVVKAIELCLDGKAQALATGPINKRALNEAGLHYSGHTEILASYCNAKSVAMMLVAGSFRVSHVTTHVSLRDACIQIKKDRILQVIKLTHDALLKMGIGHPRLAVAGLNPHAGEDGLFGSEEIEEIGPALEIALEEGFEVIGPEPPDTIFLRASRRDLGIDAVIAMYHDQGHIPVKLLGFHDGVNMTLGLPIIRTSVDHGTAFDIAGTGMGDSSSLEAAIRMATTLANN
jgi:4-hydroxythreonine-4-phosphate dehydrogenase